MRVSQALSTLFGVVAYVACGNASGTDPFLVPGASTGGTAGSSAEPGGAGGEDSSNDPTLGGPCLDNTQCDDGLDCTVDGCDTSLERCRHLPTHELCDDGVYCNGTEVCDAALGCRAAAVPTCSDEDTCTIDTCIESSRSCRHEPRDADGDGDPVRACGGSDCRDDDALVSSGALERCANQVDDDCDGVIDEPECVEPEHDRCGTALVVEQPGAYELSLSGAAGDYAFSCAEDPEALRDVVVAVRVPEGDPVDVDVTATVPSGRVLVAASTRCGSASGEVACASGVAFGDAGEVARIVVRRPEPGAALAVLVAGTVEGKVLVKVAIRESEPAPTNETCGTARPLELDTVERASLVGLAVDLETACDAETGELVYSFDLEESRDVRIRAAALDDFGEPVLSLRGQACRDADDELTCRAASPTELFARALAPGRYYLALAGTGPSDVEVVLHTEPPSEPPDDEGCDDPPLAPFGETIQIPLADHVDAVDLECLVGAPDAVRALVLSERSDVLVVQSGSEGDRGAAMIAQAPCTTQTDRLACRRSSDFPLRTVARGVAPGTVMAVTESAQGNPMSLTAFRRPASPTVLVHRADDCSAPFAIPETGGRFEGNTTNAFADFGASCDYGGQPAGGGADQLLALTLTVPRRVVFDMLGSDYDTLLVVRDASSCPGSEIAGTCAPGYVASKSFLDVTLEAGSYFVQIDGYNGASGAWALEVFSEEL